MKTILYIIGIAAVLMGCSKDDESTDSKPDEKPQPGYAGMFGGEMTGSGTKADPFHFSRPLYAQLEDAAVDGARWATARGDHSALAGSTTDGRANTWNLNKGVGGSLTEFPAANLCFNKNSDGEKAGADALVWYLPAQEQLMGVWVTHSANTSPFGSFNYWSSSEVSGDSWGVIFGTGGTLNNDKANTSRVRCVREF